MADENVKRNNLGEAVGSSVTNDVAQEVRMNKVDPTSGGSLLHLVSVESGIEVPMYQSRYTSGEDEFNDVVKVEQRATYFQKSASGQVSDVSGRLFGLMCTAASGTPTIKLWDSTAASGNVLIDTFTPVAGQSYDFHGAEALTGLYLTIGGTVSCTIFFKKDL